MARRDNLTRSQLFMNRLTEADPVAIFNIAFNSEEKAYLERLAKSKRPRDRKLCLSYIDSSLLTHNNRRFNLRLLDRLVKDKQTDIRWSAFGCVEQFVNDYPEKVWPFVVKYGAVSNYDIRQAVACMLLEVLIAKHFAKYFPRAKRLVADGDKRYFYTLAYCWPFGQPKAQWNKVVTFVREIERQRRHKR